ncbi:MAG: Stk1 family PASTA domain-containing Ser/Thr kinase [Propionibacteriaceae bacterium]|jgi:serine/threonine-protein kinase|nr:Stk1 family PASTA domain-containing Ser/Thr kinase [Propionibacteriaceae bacterium]
MTEPSSGERQILADRYILGPSLGHGGMAEVRRGRDIRLERDVAIKRLRTDLAGDSVFQARFRREAQAAAGLNHPNIVSVYDTGEQYDPAAHATIPFIVMELVVGHTLRDILQDNRKLQPERALELVQNVLAALEYSHRHGIVHRDIKPANVMVTTAGEVKVMDFGIARAVSDTAASMTQTAAVIGTPQYLSPEQVRGETVDRRSDIYATGCLLYELLAGRPPFRGDSPVSLAYQHVREQPVPPSQVDPVVSVGMDAICLKALAKDPADRYQTAKEMSDDIARLLGGQQVTALIPAPALDPAAAAATQYVPGPLAPSGPAGATRVLTDEPEAEAGTPAKRRRKILVAVIVSLAVVLVAVAVGIILWLNRPITPPEPTTVDVPRLLEMKQADAQAELERVGLRLGTVTEVNGPNDTTVGFVTLQDPKPGAPVDKGAPVNITVNIGPKKGRIPTGLKGKPKDEVAQLLREAGFTNVLEPKPAPAEGPNDQPNTVTGIEPAEGQEVPVDTAITIYYATGQTTMPDLTGQSQEAATTQLGRLGFNTPRIELVERSDVAPGTVFDQDPGSGVGVDRTQVVVTLYVAREPAPTELPSPTMESSATATPTP